MGGAEESGQPITSNIMVNKESDQQLVGVITGARLTAASPVLHGQTWWARQAARCPSALSSSSLHRQQWRAACTLVLWRVSLFEPRNNRQRVPRTRAVE